MSDRVRQKLRIAVAAAALAGAVPAVESLRMTAKNDVTVLIACALVSSSSGTIRG